VTFLIIQIFRWFFSFWELNFYDSIGNNWADTLLKVLFSVYTSIKMLCTYLLIFLGRDLNSGGVLNYFNCDWLIAYPNNSSFLLRIFMSFQTVSDNEAPWTLSTECWSWKYSWEDNSWHKTCPWRRVSDNSFIVYFYCSYSFCYEDKMFCQH